jgi:hypothetical protein
MIEQLHERAQTEDVMRASSHRRGLLLRPAVGLINPHRHGTGLPTTNQRDRVYPDVPTNRRRKMMRIRLALLTTFCAAAMAAPSSTAPAVAVRVSPLVGSIASCGTAGQGLKADAYTPAYRTYDDFVIDSGNAPDFCAGEFVTNDNHVITLGMHVDNRLGLESGDAYAVLLDTDRNAGTGGGGTGAEYKVALDSSGARLEHWNGTIFDPASAVQLPLEWVSGYGPELRFERGAIGDPSAFDFVLVSAKGQEGDRAPDAGSWTYPITPFTLGMSPLSLGRARAGRRFTAIAQVLRSDFNLPLTEGRIACAARLSGRSIAGKGRLDQGGLVVCTWALPKKARGKRLSGRVTVTFQGVGARRSFSVRVR